VALVKSFASCHRQVPAAQAGSPLLPGAGDTHAVTYTNRYADVYGDLYADGYAHGNGKRYTDQLADSFSYADSESHGDTDNDTHTDADRHCHTHTDAKPRGNRRRRVGRPGW